MKFILEIELGNDAMQTPADVRSALAHIASEGSTLENLVEFSSDDSGNIWDANGNRVGTWEVTGTERGMSRAEIQRHIDDYGNDPGHGPESDCPICNDDNPCALNGRS